MHRENGVEMDGEWRTGVRPEGAEGAEGTLEGLVGGKDKE